MHRPPQCCCLSGWTLCCSHSARQRPGASRMGPLSDSCPEQGRTVRILMGLHGTWKVASCPAGVCWPGVNSCCRRTLRHLTCNGKHCIISMTRQPYNVILAAFPKAASQIALHGMADGAGFPAEPSMFEVEVCQHSIRQSLAAQVLCSLCSFVFEWRALDHSLSSMLSSLLAKLIINCGTDTSTAMKIQWLHC